MLCRAVAVCQRLGESSQFIGECTVALAPFAQTLLGALERVCQRADRFGTERLAASELVDVRLRHRGLVGPGDGKLLLRIETFAVFGQVGCIDFRFDMCSLVASASTSSPRTISVA